MSFLSEQVQPEEHGPLLLNGNKGRESASGQWVWGSGVGIRISPFGRHLQLDQIMHNVKPFT